MKNAIAILIVTTSVAALVVTVASISPWLLLAFPASGVVSWAIVTIANMANPLPESPKDNAKEGS